MTTPRDEEIIQEVLDKVGKDLGIPPSHPVRKLLKKIGEDISKGGKDKRVKEDYDRAMKGIK